MNIFSTMKVAVKKAGKWALKNPDTVLKAADKGFKVYDTKKSKNKGEEAEQIYNFDNVPFSEQLENLKINLKETNAKLDYIVEKNSEDINFLQTQINDIKITIETLHTSQKALEKRLLLLTISCSLAIIFTIILAIIL